MQKRIATREAPAAVGHYSQAISAGGFVFCSGQIPLDPKTGELVTGGIERETEQVLANLKAVLQAAGTSFDHVVRCGIFIVNAQDFGTVNAVYSRVLGASLPARTTVVVASLPRGANVEIDAIAVVPG